MYDSKEVFMSVKIPIYKFQDDQLSSFKTYVAMYERLFDMGSEWDNFCESNYVARIEINVTCTCVYMYIHMHICMCTACLPHENHLMNKKE